MTAEQTQTADTSRMVSAADRRQQMLEEAERGRNSIRNTLTDTRDERDRLRSELKRITAEMNAQIAVKVEEVRVLTAELEEADSLLRSLQPRAPRTRRQQPERDLHGSLRPSAEDGSGEQF